VLAGCATIAAGLLFMTPAMAQFVCDSTTPGGADGATATGALSVACGTNATAGDTAATAVGAGSTASAINSSAFGAGSAATGLVSSAYGGSSSASGTGASAFGVGSSAGGANSVAVGSNSDAGGAGGVALGSGTTASALQSTAVGADASATGANSTAVGTLSVATGASSVALGNGAQATFANSTAIGSGAVSTRANQQMFGTASNTYTMAGIASAASAAAQTGPVQIVTSDAGGNLATSTAAALGLASAGDITAINARLDDLSARSSKAYAGVAMAFAMAGAPTVLPNETFVATLNWGTFQGAHGLAVSGAYRLGNNIQLNGGVAFSPNQSVAGGRAGVRVGW
jgi:autotransporter adhesin